MSGGEEIGWVGWVSIACAGLSAAILLMHLARRPTLDRGAKLWLLMGLGVFPIASAGASNVAGFEATQSRKFCGSCHVMEPHRLDSEDPASLSLASIHARNEKFGRDNCYACHKDYGMYGYVLTKVGGMRHVYYYLTEYHDMPLEQSKAAIRINKPMPNANCIACHSTKAPRWLAVPDHASSLVAVRSGQTSCASAGCHGFAHPFTKSAAEREAAP